MQVLVRPLTSSFPTGSENWVPLYWTEWAVEELFFRVRNPSPLYCKHFPLGLFSFLSSSFLMTWVYLPYRRFEFWFIRFIDIFLMFCFKRSLLSYSYKNIHLGFLVEVFFLNKLGNFPNVIYRIIHLFPLILNAALFICMFPYTHRISVVYSVF